MSLKLVGIENEYTFELRPKAMMVVGRAVNSDCAIVDATVSRRHAEISPNGDGYVVRDLDSTNGTSVNGRRIRTQAVASKLLDMGADRVILGTAALKDPQLVIDACKKYPGKIAVGIDARGGMVAVEGWAETSNISALDLAKKFEDAGVAAIIYTDIERDGAMSGPNVAATVALARAVSPASVDTSTDSRLPSAKTQPTGLVLALLGCRNSSFV